MDHLTKTIEACKFLGAFGFDLCWVFRIVPTNQKNQQKEQWHASYFIESEPGKGMQQAPINWIRCAEELERAMLEIHDSTFLVSWLLLLLSYLSLSIPFKEYIKISKEKPNSWIFFISYLKTYPENIILMHKGVN